LLWLLAARRKKLRHLLLLPLLKLRHLPLLPLLKLLPLLLRLLTLPSLLTLPLRPLTLPSLLTLPLRPLMPSRLKPLRPSNLRIIFGKNRSQDRFFFRPAFCLTYRWHRALPFTFSPQERRLLGRQDPALVRPGKNPSKRPGNASPPASLQPPLTID